MSLACEKAFDASDLGDLAASGSLAELEEKIRRLFAFREFARPLARVCEFM